MTVISSGILVTLVLSSQPITALIMNEVKMYGRYNNVLLTGQSLKKFEDEMRSKVRETFTLQLMKKT